MTAVFLQARRFRPPYNRRLARWPHSTSTEHLHSTVGATDFIRVSSNEYWRRSYQDTGPILHAIASKVTVVMRNAIFTKDQIGFVNGSSCLNVGQFWPFKNHWPAIVFGALFLKMVLGVNWEPERRNHKEKLHSLHGDRYNFQIWKKYTRVRF